MSFIEIKAQGGDCGNLIVTLDPQMANRVIRCEFNALDPLYAELVVNRLRECLSNAMREARIESYEQGWADAKAKRAKADYFSGHL